MLELSAKTEYAYWALFELARRHGHEAPVALRDVVRGYGLSEKFLLQVMLELKKGGLVESRRGKDGGYRLARPPAEVSFGDILHVTEGFGGQSVTCHRSRSGCTKQPDSCFVAAVWRRLMGSVAAIASEITLADALEQEGNAGEPMYHI